MPLRAAYGRAYENYLRTGVPFYLRGPQAIADRLLSSGFAHFPGIERVYVDARFGYMAFAPARAGESRVAAIDVGLLAHFWHPVWAKQTK
jgi:hypothetical protein